MSSNSDTVKREPKIMLRPICIILFPILLAGCASGGHTGGTDNLADLQDLSISQKSQTSKAVSSIRNDALRETAMSLGAQSALAQRAKLINAQLTQNEANLDRIFNFNLLLLDHNVLPPVLERGDNSLNLDGDNAIRIVDRTYKIVSQARFVTTPPTWRDYLWLGYTQPDVPDGSLLPHTSDERKMWAKYTEIGWQQGLVQGNIIFAQNLARLKRDYSGMILYRTLLAQNMVSPPFVARTNLGITGDSNNLRINDQVLRITALPALKQNSKLWRPVITQ